MACEAYARLVPDRPDDFEVTRRVLARQRRLGTPFEAIWPKIVQSFEPIAGLSSGEAEVKS
jgi:hypothetical protein